MDLATTPALQPPAGETSHFHEPYSSVQTGTVIAFGVTCFFSTVFLGLRWFQAFKLTKQIEVDLIIVTVAYSVSVYYFASIITLMKYGWGQHLWNVSLADILKFNEVLLPNTLTYLICPTITKMAILSVLYRINPLLSYRCIVIATGVAIFAYTLTLCAITGGPCNPLKSGTTKCLENVALAQAILNIVSDLAVISLPIPMIINLQLSSQRKVKVACIMALGSGVVVCSIARLPYVLRLDTTSDTTYVEAILGVWSIVEINLGVICACAMRLKQFISVYLPRLWLLSSRSRNTGKMTSASYTNRFRSNNSQAQHSYQLHSIQKGSAGAFAKDGISVLTSFNVDVESPNRHIGDSGSTDKILA